MNHKEMKIKNKCIYFVLSSISTNFARYDTGKSEKRCPS